VTRSPRPLAPGGEVKSRCLLLYLQLTAVSGYWLGMHSIPCYCTYVYNSHSISRLVCNLNFMQNSCRHDLTKLLLLLGVGSVHGRPAVCFVLGFTPLSRVVTTMRHDTRERILSGMASTNRKRKWRKPPKGDVSMRIAPSCLAGCCIVHNFIFSQKSKQQLS
jgi:hypothetical protein